MNSRARLPSAAIPGEQAGHQGHADGELRDGYEDADPAGVRHDEAGQEVAPPGVGGGAVRGEPGHPGAVVVQERGVLGSE